MAVDGSGGHGFDEIFIVPHAHLDLSWLGTPAECERINNRIIGAALELLERFPDYRYTVENVRPLESFLRENPRKKSAVKKHARAGRLEIGAAYVDVACDYCFDESLARNLALGIAWLESVLGIKTRIVREEDVLSHFAQTPQLLEDAGIEYFKISRGPADVFRWAGPDGSEITVSHFEYNHSYHFKLGRSAELTFRNLPGYLRWMRTVARRGLDRLMVMDGDDCTMPNAELPGIAAAWNGAGRRPRIRLSTMTEYLDTFERGELPARRGDMPGAWGGILLFEQEAAAKLQKAETLITAAEKFAAIESVGGGAEPARLGDTWRLLLAAQDHNWGGKDTTKNGPQADADKIAMIDSVMEESSRVLDSSLAGIAAGIKKSRSGFQIAVFNPLSWARTDVVEMEAPGELRGAPFRIIEPDGAEVAYEFTGGPGTEAAAIRFIARDVPPVGYRTFYIEEGAPDTDAAFETTRGARTLENEFHRIEKDVRGNGARRIIDRELDADVAGSGAVRLLEIAGLDVPFPAMFAVGAKLKIPPQEFFENTRNLKRGGTGESIEFTGGLWPPMSFHAAGTLKTAGPVSSRLTVRGEFIDSPVTHDFTLYNGLKRVDIRTTIEWRGRPGAIMSMLFPLPERMKKLHVNTPYYVHRAGSEAKGFGGASGLTFGLKPRGVQHWFSACDGKNTVTVGSQWRVWDFSAAPMALLLASDDAGGFFHGERYLHKGAHTYSFTLNSGRGDWREAMSYRRGLEPIHPLIAVVSRGDRARGGAPECRAFCEISPRNVIVTALKTPENGDGSLVVRFYEVEGVASDVRIEFPFAVEKAVAANLLEKETGRLETDRNAVLCEVGAYEIKTLKIFFAGKDTWKKRKKT